MVRLFEDGFETGDLSKWALALYGGGQITVDRIAPFRGVYHADALVPGIAGTERAQIELPLSGSPKALYHRGYVKIVSGLPLPTPPTGVTTGIRFLQFFGEGPDAASPISSMGVNYHRASGESRFFVTGIKSWDPVTGTGTYFSAWSSFPAELNKWYCVEVYTVTGTAANPTGAVKVWIDGNLIADVTGLDTSHRGTYFVKARFGLTGHSLGTATTPNPVRVYEDNYVLGTEYIGPELVAVVNILPLLIIGGVALAAIYFAFR